MEQLIEILDQMKSNTLNNYVLAGLKSHQLNNGNIRLFENTRNQYDYISPHSHRFNFTCLVLKGDVTNTMWEEVPKDTLENYNECAYDEYCITTNLYKGKPGYYDIKNISKGYFKRYSYKYSEGEIYSMKHDEIHSIQFSKDALVLFFHGPDISDTNIVLNPIVSDSVIPLSETKDYMFKRDNYEKDN